MSSFNYTDDFSGFNDLINRAEILEEKNWKELVKGADLTGKLKGYRTEEGGKIGASSRVKNLITIGALERMGLIDVGMASALRRKATSSTHITDVIKELPELYDELFEGDNPRSLEVVQYIDDNTEELIPYAVKNFTRSEYGARTEEELKSIDFRDVANDAKEELMTPAGGFRRAQFGDVEKEINTIVSSDPTTFIEIKVKDADRAEYVSKMVSRYANEDGVEISGDTIQFSVDPDMPLAIAAANLAKTGEQEKIEDQLQQDIGRITDNIVILHLPVAPDEDYEQIDDDEGEGPSLANSPGGAPSSYAAGEEGGGLTTVEDEEFIEERFRFNKGRNISRRGGSGRAGTALRQAGGGRPRYFRTGSKNRKRQEPEFRDTPPTRGVPPEKSKKPWTKKPLPPGGKPLARDPKTIKGSPIDIESRARPRFDEPGIGSGDFGEGGWRSLPKPSPAPKAKNPSMTFQGPGGPVPTPKKRPEGQKTPMTFQGRMGPAQKPTPKKRPFYGEIDSGKGYKPDGALHKAAEGASKAAEGASKYIHRGDEAMARPGYKPKAKAPQSSKPGGNIGGDAAIKSGGNYSPGFSDEEDPHIKNLYMGGGKVEEHPDYPEHEAREELEKDEREKKKKKRKSENEEEFTYSPMLDSHQTDTSGYLTEQSASDKRNKKSEVKPQSFKEKYKPKTSWQLEELRRYGL